jgi:hypothetical protein
MSYRKATILIVYGLLSAWFVLIWIFRGEATSEFFADHLERAMPLTVIAHAWITHSLFSRMNREKRLRFLLPLPIPLSSILGSRLLIVLILHGIGLAVWIALCTMLTGCDRFNYHGEFVTGDDTPIKVTGTIWTLISMTAISLYFCFWITLMHAWKKHHGLTVALWIAFIVFTWVFVYPFRSDGHPALPLEELLTSGWGSLYFGAIAAVLYAINRLLFGMQRRFP